LPKFEECTVIRLEAVAHLLSEHYAALWPWPLTFWHRNWSASYTWYG